MGREGNGRRRCPPGRGRRIEIFFSNPVQAGLMFAICHPHNADDFGLVRRDAESPFQLPQSYPAEGA